MTGVSILLEEGGLAVFEIHYAMDMLSNTEFDTIYHQHIFYFTLSSFINVLARSGLTATSVERIDSYGGSLRVYAGKSCSEDGNVEALQKMEQESLAHRFETCSNGTMNSGGLCHGKLRR